MDTPHPMIKIREPKYAPKPVLSLYQPMSSTPEPVKKVITHAPKAKAIG